MDSDVPLEQKVAFQVCKNKEINNIKEKFRMHPDWREMANFLLVKNSGRQNKYKKSQKSQISWLPVPNCDKSIKK